MLFLREARRSWREKAVCTSTWCLIVLAHFSIHVTFDYSSECHRMSLEELIELMLLLNKKILGAGREEQEKWTPPKSPKHSWLLSLCVKGTWLTWRSEILLEALCSVQAMSWELKWSLQNMSLFYCHRHELGQAQNSSCDYHKSITDD